MIIIPPSYRGTPDMIELLVKIDANLLYLSGISLPEVLKDKIRRTSLFIPVEEYYHPLDRDLKNVGEYLMFMLRAFLEQTEKTKQAVVDEIKSGQNLLTPRQEEIYNIIKDHIIVSFDTIKRRFLEVPPRTLSYDLKKIMDKKIVIKIGKTKGSYYKLL